MTQRKTRRVELFAEQNGVCCLLPLGMCLMPSTPMTLDKRGTTEGQNDYATYEHLIPKVRGGEKSKMSPNVKLSHRLCNQHKGHLIDPPAVTPPCARSIRPIPPGTLPFSYAWLVARGYIEIEEEAQ